MGFVFSNIMIIEHSKLNKKGNELILSAKIVFANGKHEELFFTIDNTYAAFVTNDANPFLASLLLPAMKLGEDIYVDSSISAQLVANTKIIMNIVSDWNIGLKKIDISFKDIRHDGSKSKGIGMFFSGGVDSFSTYLRNKTESKDKMKYLIFVHGFDYFLKDTAGFNKTHETLQTFATEENLELISPRTNLRDITDPLLDWGYAHGGALASIALFLDGGISKMHISSTYSTGHLFPWGSHPDIDPLWSTESVEIIHDSSNISRLEKIKLYISKSPVALKYLRVCWSSAEYNCGRCSKCIRTMLSLQVTSVLHQSKTFPTKLQPEIIRNFYLTSKSQVVFFEELLLELKKEKKDKEIQEAIEYMIKKSKQPDIKRSIRAAVSFIDRKYNHDRLFWYLSKKGVTRP